MDEQAARQAFERAIANPQAAFGDFFLARLMGLAFEYGPDHCRVEFQVQDFMFNPQGTLHGGLIAAVLDISMGHLLNHVDGAGTTLEMKTQYVKAARLGVLRCTGEFTHRGRSISFLRATLCDAEGDVVAFATSTWKRLKTV